LSESASLPAQAGLQDDPQDAAQWSDAVPASMPDSRAAMAEWLAALVLLVLAAVGVWHVRRPMLNMTRAARESAGGCHLAMTIREEGPTELRRVIRTFNEMLRCRHDAIEEQTVALADLARHMEHQAARLRDRALDVSEWHQRVAFVEDIDAFADIAQQLLDVVGLGKTGEQPVSVDGFLRDRYSMIGSMDQTLFTCDLKAGPQFVMSRPLLERLMTNLVDNALEHGAPPIEIRTARDQDGWQLSVRDHGAGIAEDALSSATQPFVRLNHTPRSSQHWGLGLAVVARLARRCGANLEMGNHPDGGLCVRLILPAA
jgi:two-component system osmolarity sensor histidine kinase EnvZ